MLKQSLYLGPRDLYDLIIVGIDTGMRRSKILRLTDLDYSEGSLTVRLTKNGKPRVVPCTDRVQAVVAGRVQAGRRIFPTMTNSILTRQWGTLRELMGRTDNPLWIVNVMHHTCASWLVTAGTPLADLQLCMGHLHIATTLRYAHLNPEVLKAATARLNARNVASTVAEYGSALVV